MTFKKDGADPISTRPSRLVGGLNFVGETILRALGMSIREAQPEDHLRYRRSRKAKEPRALRLRRNMRHVSKRVNRKHRRAA